MVYAPRLAGIPDSDKETYRSGADPSFPRSTSPRKREAGMQVRASSRIGCSAPSFPHKRGAGIRRIVLGPSFSAHRGIHQSHDHHS